MYIQATLIFGKRRYKPLLLHQKGPKQPVAARGRPKKPTSQEQLALDDSEVELDSLHIFFMQLIDTDSPKEEMETCQADDAEVIPISFDSETLPREKTRRVIRKV